MEIFRISIKKHSEKLTASGSANRWNFEGQNVIYAGSSRSLLTLELVVHMNAVKPKVEYKVMIISLADFDHLIKQVMIDDLPDNWRKMAAYSVLQKIGSDWYENQESLVLKVPSAVIPLEYNYVINTEHIEFSKHVHLVRTEDYFWDARLF